jgi:DNA-binding transcriptional LysR family regulator
MGQYGNALDLQWLQAFVAVVESASFRGAALALHVPKSTVSRRVAALEAHVEQTLLLRTTRKVMPTDAGRELYRTSAPALQSIRDAVRSLESPEPRGTLRVTAPVAVAEHVLCDAMIEYVRTYPEVNLVLNLTDRVVDLVAEGYDLALRAGPLKDSSLRVRAIGTGSVHCFASRTYLLQNGTPKTPKALELHRCITFEESQRTWPFVLKNKVAMVPIRSHATVNSFILARELAAAGLGIARLPDVFSAPLEQSGDLVRILTPYALAPNTFFAVTPHQAHPSARRDSFLKIVGDPRRFNPVSRQLKRRTP